MAEKTNTTANVAERKFKIISVQEITTKDGKKFNAYKTLANGGRKMDVRFVRDCKILPKEPCVIIVKETDCNVDTTRQYPILWIKDVIRIEDFERKNNVAEYFDNDDND